MRSPAKRVTTFGLVLLFTLCGLTGSAWAQDTSTSIQVETFEPLPSQGTNILNIARSPVLGHLTPSLGIFTHYSNDPLRFVNEGVDDGEEEVVSRLVEHRLVTEMWGSIGFFGFLEFGAVLPVVVFQDGEDLGPVGRVGEQIEGFAVSDLRLVPKVQLLDPGEFNGIGLAALAIVYLPIGDDESFNSDGSVRVEPRLALDWHSEDRNIGIALNAAYQVRPERISRNVVSDDVIRWGGSLQFPTGFDRLSIISSVFGSVGLSDDRVIDGVEIQNRDSPAEALVGLQAALPANLVASLGGGAGLTDGVGSPEFRFFLSFGYTPLTQDSDGDGILDDQDACPTEPEDMDGFEDSDGCPDPDNDQDGILDENDQCPLQPEDVDGFEDSDGCPDLDNDQDGVLDAQDKCPMQPGEPANDGCPINDTDGDGIPDDKDTCPTEPEDKDGFEDADGCPDIDNDQDSILDVNDKCPNDPEDRDGFEDEDGCPDLDNDNDGIRDADDKCPNEPETYNGNQDEDGCPDKGKARLIVTRTEIKILEKVFFETDKAAIRAVSYPILNLVASVLKQNSQISKLRVGGHTDDRASDDYNLELSRDRAASVKTYLISQGIEPSRLESEGYGEGRPLCTEIPQLIQNPKKNKNEIERCRALNRRVEFKIIEVDGRPIEATESVTVEETTEEAGGNKTPTNAPAQQ